MMVSTRCSSEQGDTSCREEPKGYNVTTSMSRSCNNKRGGFGLPLSITGLFAAPHHRLITACIFACTFVACECRQCALYYYLRCIIMFTGVVAILVELTFCSVG